MSPVREPKRVYPIRQILTAGGIALPFTGMRDARETTAQRPDQVLLAQNLYIAPGGGGRAYVGRPGVTPMGSAFPAPVQAQETWFPPNGVPITVAIAGGELYRYDWIADAYVKALATADLSADSVTLDPSARVALVPFGAGLVVSDGLNQACSWDGTDGGGITKLTNAPVFFGKPWVASAKLVGINAANRVEILWSEENQVNLGYDQGGYDNAWQLVQLGNAPLFAGIGLNDLQILFRERSCFTIQGAIDTDFRASGTKADLSEKIGTNAPWSVYNTASGVVFVDADARPQLAVPGSGIEPLWADCLEQLAPLLVPRASVFRTWTVEDRACNLLLIGLPSPGFTGLSSWLAFDIESLAFLGVFTNLDATAAGMVVTQTGESRWVHGNGVNAYLHGNPSEGPWSDAFRGETQAIVHVLECACLGRDLTEELVVDTIEVGLSATQTTRLTITGETPRGALPSVEAVIATSGGARLGTFILDVHFLGSVSLDRRVMVGQTGMGRWVRPIIRHDQLDEPLSITDVRVVAFKDGADPDVY